MNTALAPTGIVRLLSGLSPLNSVLHCRTSIFISFLLGISMHKIQGFKQNSKNSNLEKGTNYATLWFKPPANKQETLPSLQYRPR